MSRLPALDGLRGAAALWVLIGHVAQNAPVQSRFIWLFLNNGLAVDLFMLLSGFLMFYLHHEAERSRPIDFLARRFFRLAPLYYFCLVLGFAVTPLFASWGDLTWSHAGVEGWALDASSSSFATHLSFLFGLFPAYQASTPLPDWSLSLEAQFYIFFPFAAAMIRRMGMIGACILMLLVSAMLGHSLLAYTDSYVFSSVLPLKLHVFLAGMLLAKLVLDGFHLQTAILALIAVLVPVTEWTWRYEFTRVALLLLIFVCTSPTAWRGARIVQAVFAHPVLRWAGDMSYGVYLIHLIVMYGAFFYFIPILGDHHVALFSVVLLITIVLSYAIACALHVTIELPGVELRRRVARLIKVEAR